MIGNKTGQVNKREVQTTFDPRISEWGNPPILIDRYP